MTVEKNKKNFWVFFNEPEYDFLLSSARRADCEVEYLALQEVIQNVEIVVCRQGKGDHLYDQFNILPRFADIFSEKFDFYLQEYPWVKDHLETLGIIPSLPEQLTSMLECFRLSEALHKLYSDYSRQLDSEKSSSLSGFSDYKYIDDKDLEQMLEFLNFMSDITSFLSNRKSTQQFNGTDSVKVAISKKESAPTLNWCAYCFRRASSKVPRSIVQAQEYKQTCRVHSSGSSNDRAYRDAKERERHLSDEDRKYINQIHAERKICELMESRAAFPKSNDVSHEAWMTHKSGWINGLRELVPYEKIEDFESWSDYVRAFHKLLENEGESTTDPRWIIDICVEAKIWSELDKKHPKTDARKTDSKDEIVRLYNAGSNSTSIAKALNKSPAYVSKVLKEWRSKGQ